VDQTRYVGFSFGYGPKITSSKDAGVDMVQFILGWRLLFPEYKNSDIFLASESYGGHFVPAWADALNDFNEQDVSEKAAADPKSRLRGYREKTSRHYDDEKDAIRLKGLLIGNGATNNTVQNAGTYEEFLMQAHLLPDNYNPQYSSSSDGLSPPSLFSLRFSKEVYQKRQKMDREMEAHIGYRPNFYDYRLKSETCDACVSYNYTSWAHWFTLPEVTKALNVCGNAGAKAFEGRAAGCVAMPNFDADDTFDYSGALARSLDKGIKVMVYYGKQDLACDFVGGYAMANSIEWRGKTAFEQMQLDPLIIAGQEMGQWKSHSGLTFVQIDGAGHMVPLDQPAAGARSVGDEQTSRYQRAR